MFKKLRPDLNFDNIYQIDADLLTARGIRGIFFDIDNTMEPYSTPVPGARLTEWLSYICRKGFAIGILSNARQERIEKFISGFPEELRKRIFYVFGAGKPLKKGFLKLCGIAGLAPDQAAMTGDQLFTDILGGNRSGLLTILVQPIDPSIEPPFVRFKRIFERPFLK